MEIVQNDDDMKDEDEDVDIDANKNKNRNTDTHITESKRFVIRPLNQYKFEDKGVNVSDFHYCGENLIIVGNEEGEFRMVNMEGLELVHQWKAIGPLEQGNVCKFAVNEKNDCVVYGNGAHQVQI